MRGKLSMKNARKDLSLRALECGILAVQGINGGFGVLNVALLDVLDLTQTGDLALHGREVAGGLELAQPGIVIRTGHIVVGVVTGNDHQGAAG